MAQNLHGKKVKVIDIDMGGAWDDPFGGEVEDYKAYIGRIGTATAATLDPEKNEDGAYIVKFEDGRTGQFVQSELALIS